MSVHGSLRSAIHFNAGYLFLIFSPISCVECGGLVVITCMIPSFSINSQAFLKAYLFQPLLGSGIKKFPLMKRLNFSFRDVSLLFANPDEGTFDLSCE